MVKPLINFGDGSSYTFWFSLVKAINYVFVLILLCAVLFKKTTQFEILIASFIFLTNFAISTGGYILIIYINLIPYLWRSKEYKKLIIFILLIYALPMDWINLIKINYLYMYSYLGGDIFIDNPVFLLSIGSVVRPLINFSLLITFLIILLKKYPRINLAN